MIGSMHIVQVTKSPKPVASCAMPAGPGMDIKTDTPLVKKAREGVMEFLLVCNSLVLYYQTAKCLIPMTFLALASYDFSVMKLCAP